ncbi:MAG: phage/plasmid primase, P4 family, partial [Herbinix sp.]|nr:phage/plasmid primase, P4 family [Herbinix sp.]
MNINNKYNNIPQDLKEINNWVGFKIIQSDGKDKKIPVNPNTGKNAKVNQPSTWGTYTEAIKSVSQYSLDGIGFVFTLASGYIGIDIDNCIDGKGEYTDKAQNIISLLNSYSEKSVSGRGIHIVIKGEIPNSINNRAEGIEIYDNLRYFVFTGYIVSKTNVIMERNYEINLLHNVYKNTRVTTSSIDMQEHKVVCNKEIALDSNNNKLERLFNGDMSKYIDDHSRADLALAYQLAGYTNNNPELMDVLFRSSSLFREKWDDKHYSNGDTYGQATINKAIETNTTKKHTQDKPWYEYNKRTDGIRINTGLLARELVNSYPVINIMGGIYLYSNGYYKLTGKAERYARVKSMIEDEYVTSNILRDAEFSWVNDKSAMIHMDSLYKDPYLLNLQNGIYSIKEKTLYPHTQQHISINQLNCSYVLNAECPVFLQYLNDIIKDTETILLLQEVFGYFLIPETYAQKCFIIVGQGNTGKSTFLKAVQIVIGNMNISFVPLQKLSDRFSTAELFGKLVNICPDLPTTVIRDTGVFKIITGEDTVLAEKKYESAFTFNNKARLIFSCNKLPDSSDKSDAFFNRLIIIPFNHKIKKMDPYLGKKIENEKNGILLWALDGLTRLIDNNFNFTEN